MKKVTFVLSVLIISIFVLPIFVLAHPGKTDSKGGHYDHSTGEYHYHHGYPAHQHEDDSCPYDFDDKTNHSSSKDSSSAQNSNASGSSDSSDHSISSYIDDFLIIIAIFFVLYVLPYIIYKWLNSTD